MEFQLVKEWKEKELEGYKKAREYYFKHSEELQQLSEQTKKDYLKGIEEYKNKYGKDPVKHKTYRIIYEDKELDTLYSKKESIYHEYINFTYNENTFYHLYGRSEDFEDRCKQQIDKHFEKLQAKVEKKIGSIKEINDLGGENFLFIGTEGQCKVEVIWAGGYNIQRLHTRWIVKK